MASDSGPSVGLVLGAGGIVGAAWHGAALAALAEVGWDARTAGLVVGTSAGSGTASALRLGIPPSDLLAAPLGEPLSEIGARYAEKAGPAPEIPAPEIGGRIPRPASPAMAVRALRQPWKLRPMVAAAGVMPRGRVPTAFIGDRIRKTHETDWPEAPTWICTVRLRDGERVVFGRDAEAEHLADAVEASSAIPGFFAPVDIGGDEYVDGGVHSATNADLVAGLGFDIVVISSPMSATSSALQRPKWTGGRVLHAANLRREVEQIRAGGTPVLVLQPGPEVVDTAGANSMDSGRRADVARVAHDSIRQHLASDRVLERLSILCG